MSEIDELDRVSTIATASLGLLREATEWRLLGLLLAAPRGDWRHEVAALAGSVDDADLQAAVQLALEEADESLYDTAFGPGGPAPPREVTYRPASLSSQHLAELAGAYQAFGYHSPNEEPLDHVAVLIDFVAYLRLKEAFATARGACELAATTREAASHIVAEHLSYLSQPLAERLMASGVRYLALAADALCRRTGPPPLGVAGELAVLGDEGHDGAAWACGECEDNCSDL